MNRILLTIAFVAALCLVAAAQSPLSHHDFRIVRGATVDVSVVSDVWHAQVFNTVEEDIGPEPDKAELERVKKIVSDRYPAGRGQRPELRTQVVNPPTMLRNFQGNVVNGFVPNDNTMAVSNGGKLVTSINSNVYMYNIPNDSLLKAVTLTTFTPTSLGLPTGSLFDPKALYDPIADRFILVYLNVNFTNTTVEVSSTRTVVAFSATNDPVGAWNVYALPGNPLNDTTFTDYPSIAITQNELFITGNAVIPGQTWQTGFKQTYIWQLNKQDGYAGNATLTSRLWTNVQYGGRNIRYLCPVNGGSQPYGPNEYFLSNKNFGVQTDSLFLIEVTGLQSDTNTTVHVTYFTTNVPYSTPPDARQAGGQTFATNDARQLGAFMENGKIQYVQNTLDTVTGHPAVYHGVIDNITTSPSATGMIIADNVLDFGYPNISYTGTSATDNSSIISFDYSATAVFAGCAALIYDGQGNYSVTTNIRSGDGYVNMLTSTQERWGDYSGTQRKYDEPGKVWTALTFGLTNHNLGTWISELSVNATNSVPATQVQPLRGFAYPNPMKDIVSISFNNPISQRLLFEICNTEGRLISNMLDEDVKIGENIFSFSTTPLSRGVYFLKIVSADKTIFSQKVIKAAD